MLERIKNLALGKLPHYTRKARHIKQLFRHATPRKLLNLVYIEWALQRGKIRLKGMPYIYIIDPTNACDLRCPLCPTGAKTMERETRMMSFECYKRIIDEIKDYAVEVILYSWGESFLNPRIFDMIRYAQDNNIGTNLSSHFNNISDKMIDEIIDSGLENINISLDGVTQEVYEHYRVNGKVDQVIESLKKLQARKQILKCKTPVVEWQYIVMKQNEHEIPSAQRLAKEIGVESFRLLGVGLPFDELTNMNMAEQWISETPDYRGYHPEKILEKGYLYDEVCFYPFRSMVINPDGGVAPCCAIAHEKWDFGHIKDQNIRDIWNNQKYRSARSLFSRQPIEDYKTNVCEDCVLYNQVSPRKKKQNIENEYSESQKI